MGDYYDYRTRARGGQKEPSSVTNDEAKNIVIKTDARILEQSGEIPCRACRDFRSWMKAGGNPKNGPLDQPENTSCPLDRSELGRHTWYFLHTMAAYYPQQPSKDEQEHIQAFFKAFGQFYPCDHCANDFRQEMQKSPPRVTSRWELSMWLCEQHNIVNKKIGKTEFDCSRVLERWLVGPPDGSCS
ncbi:FAD-linked sulfhydryl oxidase ALR-like isoform X2 [Varroa jacobsoni]|uniref:Sulfhydryl oxidase n=1 Tax=Varroa destructor TaxID=109461 RepID=A0A7M7K6K1_VARDE|nr:FAD-linked sulfhydryl oxidase ALR-like isoform X2 [Varroa destructor]XP_022709563.1 FAD-linked sulfhydryl oxidase ALR-like isoform X2 [Varroa jacobsoni]